MRSRTSGRRTRLQSGEDRSFESLTRPVPDLDSRRAALVFSVDQVEDLRFFPDAEERFQSAVRDLIQIANRLTTSSHDLVPGGLL